MARMEAYRKWFDIVGRKVHSSSPAITSLSSRRQLTQLSAYPQDQTVSNSIFTSSSLSLPFRPSDLSNRNLLPWAIYSPKCIGMNQQAFRFCTKDGSRGNLEAVGVPTSVPVRVAHELLLAGHRFLDVRTHEEFSAGHVVGAINISYLHRVRSGMAKNPKFLEEVSSHFGKHDEILVGCQIGKRSMMAATDLLAAGYTGITDIAGGYASWTQNGLPTEN